MTAPVPATAEELREAQRAEYGTYVASSRSTSTVPARSTSATPFPSPTSSAASCSEQVAKAPRRRAARRPASPHRQQEGLTPMPAPSSVAVNVLSDPGYLWMAPLGTAEPTTAVVAGKFSDALPAAWVPLGATTEGSTFSYSTSIEAIRVAEYFDPIKYSTTERNGSIAFNLANFTLSNWKRALNGGVAALTSTGTTGTELTTFEPPAPGPRFASC
jgi:hypothetical protein